MIDLLLLAALPALTPAQGAAASSEPHATAAAAEVLAAGGNAVDAAVAAGFALAVSYPVAGNLGGGGFLLYRAPDGQAAFLDFREVAPAAATAGMYLGDDGEPLRQASLRGWRAAGVPGSVAGMAEAHRRWGSRPWASLLAPAIRLAEDGFPISAGQSESFGLSASTLGLDPLAASRFYRPDGSPLPPGALLRQPELAATLRAVAERGDRALRNGPVVEELLRASDAAGGIFTAADFAGYQPVLRPVARIEWQGRVVLAPTAPSSGGLYLAQTLGALERFPLRGWGWDDARSIQLIGEASARAFVDRNRWLGDPAGFDFDVGRLSRPDYLERRFGGLSPARWTRPDRLAGAGRRESEQTTHYSVVDGRGGACSVTTTLNGAYGAKVMAPGGFLMNNEMDDFAAAPGRANQFGLVQGAYNAVAAGRRPLSSMCPVIVEQDGELDAVLGSPGGPTILSTVLQVLLNRYTFGMPPRRAVAAPRFHRQDRPAQLQYEPGRLDAAARHGLEQVGQPLRLRASIGDVNAVFRRGGRWQAVADPRRGGAAMVVERELAAEAAGSDPDLDQL